MLVGYEANNATRNSHELGDFSRELITRIANHHIAQMRALLFTKRIKGDFRTFFTSYSNISTYVPSGLARLIPSLWMRFGLNGWLKSESVKVFHGLNAELPYGIGRDVKTLITFYGLGQHHRNSLIDSLMWKTRMKYAFRASDVIVAVSQQARQELLDMGVNESKIELIECSTADGVTDQVAERYYAIYQRLSGLD